MGYDRITKEMNKFSVLVHQLSPEDKNDALSYFSKESIEKVSVTSNGLCISFKHYDPVIKSIRRQKIEVKGLFYKIYPMVTNLTVRGIAPYATNSIIEDAMQSYGSIIDSYRIQETEQRADGKTVTLTDDYRIILDVPEVFADFNLSPVSLPKITRKTFKVSFFCRFCRQNGHMQFQCPSITNNSSSLYMRYHSEEFSKRSSCESSSFDLDINQDKIATSPQSHFHVDRPFEVSPDSLVQNENEQHSFFDRSCSFKKEFHRHDCHHNLKKNVKNSFSNSKRCHDKHSTANNTYFKDKSPKNDSHNESQNVVENSFSKSKLCHNEHLIANNTYFKDMSHKNNSHNESQNFVEHSFSKSKRCHNERRIANNTYFKKFHKNDSHNLKNFVKNSFSKSKRCHDEHRIANNTNTLKKYRQDRFSLPPVNGSEKLENDYPPTLKKLSTEIPERRRSYEKKDFRQHSVFSENASEKLINPYPSSSKESPTEISKRRKSYDKKDFHQLCTNDKEKFKIDYSCPSTLNQLPTEISERRSSWEKKDLYQQCDNEEIAEGIETATSNKYSEEGTSTCKKEKTNKQSQRKNEKEKFMSLLPKLLPPDTDLLETEKIIKTALKMDAKNIPAKVEDGLRNILNYNCELGGTSMDERARRFIRWIRATLSKIKQEKFRSENPVKKQAHVKDKMSAAEIPREQVVRKRKVTLSLGIRQAIAQAPGILEPEFLCNFLNQVRNRRKLFEVVSAFTENIPALASQLLEVQNAYYKYVQKRGRAEDRDISYIKRLRIRLLEQNKTYTEISLEGKVAMTETAFTTDMTRTHEKMESERSEVSEKTESDIPEVSLRNKFGIEDLSVKTETEMADVFVKTESDTTEVSVKTESDISEASVRTGLGLTDVSVKREESNREVPVKYEAGMLTRQTSREEDFIESNLTSSNRYAAYYYTNITQRPFSLTAIKTEVED